MHNKGFKYIRTYRWGDKIGGLVGYTFNGESICEDNTCEEQLKTRVGIVEDCYSDCEVEGDTCVGGLIGIAEGCTISNSGASGNIIGKGAGVGGLIGYAVSGERGYEAEYCRKYVNTQDGIIENSYSDCNVNGSESVGGLVGLSEGYIIYNSATLGIITGSGDGIGGLVGYQLNGENRNRNVKEGWVRWMNTHNGIIKHSNSQCKVNGNSSIGGLVGLAEGCIIDSSNASGSVSGEGSGIGGLVGYTVNATVEKNDNEHNWKLNAGEGIINKSSSSGEVYGNHVVGGLIGGLEGGKVINCYASGNIESEGSYAGGLIGYTYGGEIDSEYTKELQNVYIGNSYSIGNVKGYTSVGGFIGYLKDCVVDTSYSVGYVNSRDGACVGGLIGCNIESEVNRCYWDIDTSELLTSAGGIGKNTNQMKKKYRNSGDAFEGWDFIDIWDIIENDTYPYLRNNEPSPLPGL